MWIAPDGSRITGTIEDIFDCVAGITDIDAKTGEPEYDGETEVNWNGQKTRTRDGKMLFSDDDGGEWTFDQLTNAEEGADDGTPILWPEGADAGDHDGSLDQFIRCRVAWKDGQADFDGGPFALAFSGEGPWTVEEAISLIDEYATRYGIYPDKIAAGVPDSDHPKP